MCEIIIFIMKYYSNNLLSFDRNPKTSSAIHKLFGTLIEMEWDTRSIYSMSEKNWVTINKDQIDIIKVDFDYSELYNEYIRWSFGHPDKIKLPIWSLNKEKTDLFLKSLEACVLYYLSRKKLFTQSVMDDVLDLYAEIFRKKLFEFNLN